METETTTQPAPMAGVNDDTLREWRTGAWYANRTDLMELYTGILRDRACARFGIPPQNYAGHELVECSSCGLWFYNTPGQKLHGPGVCKAAR